MFPVCLLKFTHLKAIVLEAIIQSNNNLKVSLLLSLTDVGNICFSVSMSTCVNWQLLANVSVIVYWRRGAVIGNGRKYTDLPDTDSHLGGSNITKTYGKTLAIFTLLFYFIRTFLNFTASNHQDDGLR